MWRSSAARRASLARPITSGRSVTRPRDSTGCGTARAGRARSRSRHRSNSRTRSCGPVRNSPTPVISTARSASRPSLPPRVSARCRRGPRSPASCPGAARSARPHANGPAAPTVDSRLIGPTRCGSRTGPGGRWPTAGRWRSPAPSMITPGCWSASAPAPATATANWSGPSWPRPSAATGCRCPR